MWEQEARTFLMGFVTGGTIWTGDLVGVNENDNSAIAIVIMSDGGDPPKAVEKYYFLKKIGLEIKFYEMDRLPSRT